MKTSRSFTSDDQLKFAALSGDFNPMHVDPVAARRTQAGAPVVHGIHALLWLLEGVAEQHPDLPSIAVIKVRFARIIYVGDKMQAAITQQDSVSLRAEITVDGVTVLSVNVTFGAASPETTQPTGELIAPPAEPLERTLEEMADQSGRLAFAGKAGDMQREFPHAARVFGAHRLAALGATTFLVGMALPGLHSLYAGLSLSFCEGGEMDEALSFTAKKVDLRFRLVQLEVSGGGISGVLETFARHAPVEQATYETIAPLVSSDEFSGVTALIVGGSRGLGELTAKTIAAGGGDVIITYAVGADAAEAVAADITAHGGRCRIIPYNVLEEADPQLSEFSKPPTDIYYFATPAIFRGKPDVFSQDLFDEFKAFYVDGFEALVEAGVQRRPEGVRAFYPSSVAVDEQPPGMEEYAKSKAAGEKLCADMEEKMPKARIMISRLPRLPTDQTATIQHAETADPLDIMLPIIRALSAG